MSNHPWQPIVQDENGTLRFKENAIVRFLLDHGPYSLNRLSIMSFSDADREQFAQLIGQSLADFLELSHLSDEAKAQAQAAAMDMSN